MNNLTTMKTYRNHILLLLISFLFMTSCGITKKYKTPEMETQGLYRTEAGYKDSLKALSALPMETFFTDSLLNGYLDEAMAKNHDMRIAFERIHLQWLDHELRL